MCKLCTVQALTTAVLLVVRDVLAGPESDPTDELYARPVLMPWHDAPRLKG